MRYILIPAKAQEKEETKGYSKDTKDYSKGSKDWPFMEEAGKVLNDLPATWKQYPDSIKGRCEILAMEFGELQNAVTKEEKLHEAVHVGAAALHLWSALNEQ